MATENSEAKPRTNMQTVQGKLCVELYETLGEAALPSIRKIYGLYGLEIGRGLKEKWKPQSFEQVGELFIQMCNQAGYKSSIRFENGVAHWEGHVCPFGLNNTHKEVCEAMMAMDREMFRALHGTSSLELVIRKSLAAGDDCCAGTFRVVKDDK